jgi:UDP-galactopyranose mutase
MTRVNKVGPDSIEFDNADLIVVGAGFYGMTVAERAAAEGFNVVVVDKRDHIGGNAYSYEDSATGIEIHKYGPHVFHTNSEQIFAYLSKFTEWSPYEQRTWSLSKGRVYPLPINLATISLFNGRVMSPTEARAWVAETAREITEPRNLEEKAISLIGRPLYETFVKGYTAKQWQTDPTELPADIISRLPVRFNYDNRYFNDTYQCLPRNGYTPIFEKMRDTRRIAVHLNVDWFDLPAHTAPPAPVVYTGPIDRYFDYRFGVLGWRTIDLELETIETEDFQGCPVMNYADADIPWTRISEFKHFHPSRSYGPRTVIAREFSRSAGQKDDPYYPINLIEDKARYNSYRELARAEKDVFFGGRLGTYRYLDMHQAIGAALTAWEKHLRPHLANGAPLELREVG